MTTDHAQQLEQQITDAWQRYTTASLDGRAADAATAYEDMDRLVDRLPRPRAAEHDQHPHGSGQAPT